MKKVIIFLIALVIILVVYYFYPQRKLDTSKPIDKLLVLKSERKLFVLCGNEVIKEYTIALGRNPMGAKHFEGDYKTPEGIYKISSKNPSSGYYLNLGISYPSGKDIDYAKKCGKRTGGDIKIHGLKIGMGFIGKFHRWFNWTLGCIALTNNEMDELYNHVEIGTIIEIKP